MLLKSGLGTPSLRIFDIDTNCDFKFLQTEQFAVI